MSLFSNIVDSIKNTVSSISDTAVNFIGNIADTFKSDKPYGIETTGSYEPSGIGIFEDFEYDSLYDDYMDWIESFWY